MTPDLKEIRCSSLHRFMTCVDHLKLHLREPQGDSEPAARHWGGQYLDRGQRRGGAAYVESAACGYCAV